jgi:hypothetical protein
MVAHHPALRIVKSTEELPHLDIEAMGKPKAPPELAEAQAAADQANAERAEWVRMMEEHHGIKRP